MVDMCYIEAKAPRLSPIGDSCGAFYYARVWLNPCQTKKTRPFPSKQLDGRISFLISLC